MLKPSPANGPLQAKPASKSQDGEITVEETKAWFADSRSLALQRLPDPEFVKHKEHGIARAIDSGVRNGASQTDVVVGTLVNGSLV